MTVQVFVEGGGQGRTQIACRRAFRQFFDKAVGETRLLRVEACGGRDEAYKDFCRQLRADPETFAVLLVDSEGPIAAGDSAWEHLRKRDRWTKPQDTDDRAHLMVQCMEAWFIADDGALADFHGQGFHRKALPANPRKGEVPRDDVMTGLNAATKAASKGMYHKTRHGFAILEKIDPKKVSERSLHAKTFLDMLTRVIRESSNV